MGYLRPKVFNSIKLRDQPKVCLPSFAFIIFKKPECPSKNKKLVSIKYGSFTSMFIAALFKIAKRDFK